MATKKEFHSVMVIVNDVKRTDDGSPIINQSANGNYYYTLTNTKAEKFIRENGMKLLNKNKSVNCYFDTMDEAEAELALDLADIKKFSQLQIEKITVIETEIEDEV